MSVLRLFQRFRRKPLPVLLVLAVLIIFSTFFKIGNPRTIINYDVLNERQVKDPLTKKLLPLEIFDTKIKGNKRGARIIASSFNEKLSDPSIANESWRLTADFINSKIDPSLIESYLESYTEKRKVQHLYDPRITLPVYFSHMNDQYSLNSSKILFSWEDWVDLSYLNKFLGDGKKTCNDFFHSHTITLNYDMDPESPSSTYANVSYCLDDDEYLLTEYGKFKDRALLPGFNFMQRIDEKSNFIGKIFNAKSYLLSYSNAPNFIYFLNDNGTYHKVKPELSSSMMKNGMFESFVQNTQFNEFDSVEAMNRLNKDFLLHDQDDFSEILKQKSKFQIDIPESKFVFEPAEQFSHLLATDRSLLEDNEKKFLESLEFSLGIESKDVKKHFKEVNIKWPAKFNNHKLTEDGGHYDARFFSGFFSEMPAAAFTFHSPEFDPNTFGFPNLSIDSAIERRTIILSHLIHTLLTVTFHDGLLMFPAHGSLLSWYFTGTSFPWDSDGDVQMPVADLAEFCLRFNNSMIVENPRYGTAKAFVDCTSTLTHRGKGNGNNNIDARVIDVDSGLFIDITGLGVSSDALSYQDMNKIDSWVSSSTRKSYPYRKKSKGRNNQRNKKGIKGGANDVLQFSEEEENMIFNLHKENKIYNCRNDHYYTYNQLSPVRLTLFEGAPAFVAAAKESLKSSLEMEYTSNSMKRAAWETWMFSKTLRTWLNADDVYHSLLSSNIDMLKVKSSVNKNKPNIKGAMVLKKYLENEAAVLCDLIKESIYGVTSEEGLQSENQRNIKYNIVEGLYHDRLYTGIHAREMAIFHTDWEWRTTGVEDHSGLPSNWGSLGSYMLSDHPPPKMALLDYLLLTERDKLDKEKKLSKD